MPFPSRTSDGSIFASAADTGASRDKNPSPAPLSISPLPIPLATTSRRVVRMVLQEEGTLSLPRQTWGERGNSQSVFKGCGASSDATASAIPHSLDANVQNFSNAAPTVDY